MKNITRLFYVLSLFIFIGCSSDDSNDGNAIPGNDLNLGSSAHDLLANDIFSSKVI